MYAVVDTAVFDDPEATVAAVLRAGVRLVQLRGKAGVDPAMVRALHSRTRSAGALLFINDDPAVAALADGLHVGQEDLALLGDAARDYGKRGLLGVSCGLPSEVDEARKLGAAYLGVGPFAATANKHDAGPAIGASGIGAVVAAARGIPVAAIGGIGLSALDTVVRTGARMAAVISALDVGESTEAAARALVERWNGLTAAAL